MKNIFLLLLLNIAIIESRAEVFCVSDSVALKAALTAASSNGENDEIRLKSGQYPTVNNTAFIYSPSDNSSLEISGGWFDLNQFECFNQGQNPMNTILDGMEQSNVLFFGYNDNYPVFSLDISNLTISNGISNTSNAAGLQMALPDMHAGAVVIDRVYFFSHNAAQVSALTINRADLVIIRNSVFQFNQTTQGNGVVKLSPNEDSTGVYFINNTLINNTHELDDGGNSGLLVAPSGAGPDGLPKTVIVNNLLWSNQGHDITPSGIGTVYLFNNNYESMNGAVDFFENNISQPPMLNNAILNFTPLTGSPLIDRGKNQALVVFNEMPFEEKWQYGNQDFDGFGRVTNRQVDIGAVEAPPEVPIFENGFD